MTRKKRYSFQVPEKLHEMLRELTPENHTMISTLWDAVNLLKEKREK